MYRYTTRNVHLHGQLSLSIYTFNYLDCDIDTAPHVSYSAALVPLIAHTIHCQSCTRAGHVADEPSTAWPQLYLRSVFAIIAHVRNETAIVIQHLH